MPAQVPVPDGHDPDLDDYSPSNHGSQEAISNVEEEPEREVSGNAPGAGAAPPLLDLETVRSVEHNEQLDGNGPGAPSYDAVCKLLRNKPSKPYYQEAVRSTESGSSQAWFSFEEGERWVFASDSWESVNNDVVVRYHNVPRARLCNPNKVRGMAMPRRLKHRHTFMVYDDGRMEIKVDNWFKQRKNPGTTQESWVGFTVFSTAASLTVAADLGDCIFEPGACCSLFNFLCLSDRLSLVAAAPDICKPARTALLQIALRTPALHYSAPHV